MTTEQALARVRHLADRDSAALRRAIAELSPEVACEVLARLALADAARRAADALAGRETAADPPADIDGAVDLVAYGDRLRTALDGIEDVPALLTATTEGLTEPEARLVLLVDGLRTLAARGRTL